MTTCTDHAAGHAARGFYLDALARLERAGIDVLVGGAFAFARYTGIERDTKDFDLFIRPGDLRRALALFEAGGYQAELKFPHWLGKVYFGEYFIDLIYSSGNSVATVDDLWFEHAVEAEVLGRPARLMPAEEMIWSKAYVHERERYDGADVMHLFRQLGPALDWQRLLTRFGDHWRVLLSFVVQFGFVYPDVRDRIPFWVSEALLKRLAAEQTEPRNRVCNGTLLSREQYLADVDRFGYRDPRVEPLGRMTVEEAELWTAAINEK